MTAELANQMFEFIDTLARDYEDPQCWPLAHDEQIRFVRRVLCQVREIRQSRDFLTHKVEKSASNALKESRRHGKSPKTTLETNTTKNPAIPP